MNTNTYIRKSVLRLARKEINVKPLSVVITHTFTGRWKGSADFR